MTHQAHDTHDRKMVLVLDGGSHINATSGAGFIRLELNPTRRRYLRTVCRGTEAHDGANNLIPSRRASFGWATIEARRIEIAQ